MPAPPPASFSLASRTLAAPAPVPPTRRSPFSLLRRTAPPGWFPAGLPSAELRPSAFSIRVIIHPQYPARFQDHLVLETDPTFRIIFLYRTILDRHSLLVVRSIREDASQADRKFDAWLMSPCGIAIDLQASRTCQPPPLRSSRFQEAPLKFPFPSLFNGRKPCSGKREKTFPSRQCRCCPTRIR